MKRITWMQRTAKIFARSPEPVGVFGRRRDQRNILHLRRKIDSPHRVFVSGASTSFWRGETFLSSETRLFRRRRALDLGLMLRCESHGLSQMENFSFTTGTRCEPSNGKPKADPRRHIHPVRGLRRNRRRTMLRTRTKRAANKTRTKTAGPRTGSRDNRDPARQALADGPYGLVLISLCFLRVIHIRPRRRCCTRRHEAL